MYVKCKYQDCLAEGQTVEYISFFPSETIQKASEKNPALPRYGFHVGVDCPKCGRWQYWIKQTEQNLLSRKFYSKDQNML
jgi:hypothetical protein